MPEQAHRLHVRVREATSAHPAAMRGFSAAARRLGHRNRFTGPTSGRRKRNLPQPTRQAQGSGKPNAARGFRLARLADPTASCLASARCSGHVDRLFAVAARLNSVPLRRLTRPQCLRRSPTT